MLESQKIVKQGFGDITPLVFIDYWDFILVILAAFIRMLFSMKYKALSCKVKKQKFQIKKYFDSRHIVRWSTHFLTAITMLLVLPEVFTTFIGPKYFPELSYWTFSADFVIGFLGYDLVKFIERATKPIIEKIFNTTIK